jgi:hypothetical protein
MVTFYFFPVDKPLYYESAATLPTGLLRQFIDPLGIYLLSLKNFPGRPQAKNAPRSALP